MSNNEEESHILGLRSGDSSSFEWLYERYVRLVYSFCYSFTKSRCEAEELTSDVFVQLWRKRAIISPHGTIKSFLLKVSKDLIWNYFKRTSRRRDLMRAYIQNYCTKYGPEADLDFRYLESLDVINTAIKRLSPQQQKIFRLRYLNGLDLTEISLELSISKNTVKSHLFTAKNLVLHYFRLHCT